LSRRRHVLGVVAGVTAVVAATTVAVAAHPARSRGDIRVFAHIAPPGEPSLTLVTPKHKVYVGTFEDVAGSDTSPSKVFKYDAAGKLRRTYVIHGQTAGAAHGVQVAERDRRGRLYILDQNPSRVVRLNPRTGKQHTYATFADVPTCSAAATPTRTTRRNPTTPHGSRTAVWWSPTTRSSWCGASPDTAARHGSG
jgi:hypothetical protein